jgi:hypothetical protein
MRDVLFVAITIGFFALCVAYIRACARIIGHEAPAEPEFEADVELVEVAPR